MHLLYEDGGDIKIATLISGSDSEPLAVESLGGKRGKLKSKDVWLRFEYPKPDEFLSDAKQLAEEVDLDFLWECAGDGEFLFTELAKEYFGDPATPIQQTTLAIALQAAPVYFRRKGRGQFMRAPEDQLKAALLAVERKKLNWLNSKLGKKSLNQENSPKIFARKLMRCYFLLTKIPRHTKRLLTRPRA